MRGLAATISATQLRAGSLAFPSQETLPDYSGRLLLPYFLNMIKFHSKVKISVTMGIISKSLSQTQVINLDYLVEEETNFLKYTQSFWS